MEVPWARDYWGFNPEVQFLANNGYAVLQMNYQGIDRFWQVVLGIVVQTMGPHDAGRYFGWGKMA